MSNTNNRELYPEIHSYKESLIIGDDTHEIFIEESGNPDGQPILFLHGGPGGGTGSKQRRFFDPSHYRIILFDQRGCGKSKPLGETKKNTTDNLVNDIELIRKELNIKAWILFGGSWGSTLALAYAIKHPELVQGLILRGVFLSRKHELDWFLKDVDIFFPELHHNLLKHIPNTSKKNLLEKYTELVFSNDKDCAYKAAISWNQFEGSILKLLPPAISSETIEIDNEFELARAKVQIHYINNNCFVDGEDILEKSKILKDIPITIIQGRYDMVCPPKTAYELHQAIPQSKLIIIPDAGHSASEAGTLSSLLDATDEFKTIAS
ncbi:prolyl aminopeptidase [Nitrosomonadales bacterium]|nr:prolyl aminopeptidase [Nitrosomonadales bacterium]MDA9635582.1 prolyl aminopeptidase [Nitrosomonadales bacterium]